LEKGNKEIIMKFSARTLTVLKNFATINPSIQFNEGNVLRTISPNKTILAKATLSDTIEGSFCIYDLSRFLGVVSLFEDPTFELKEKLAVIKSQGRKVSYTYADPSTFVLPPNKEIKLPTVDINFKLTAEQYSEIMKALGVMSFPDLVVAGEEGKIYLRATDTKNPSADKYDIEVGDTDGTFSAVFRTENLKMLSGSYDVSISSKGISHFKSDDIEYWVSVESNSTF
jgi:hypothetical protein